MVAIIAGAWLTIPIAQTLSTGAVFVAEVVIVIAVAFGIAALIAEAVIARRVHRTPVWILVVAETGSKTIVVAETVSTTRILITGSVRIARTHIGLTVQIAQAIAPLRIGITHTGIHIALAEELLASQVAPTQVSVRVHGAVQVVPIITDAVVTVPITEAVVTCCVLVADIRCHIAVAFALEAELVAHADPPLFGGIALPHSLITGAICLTNAFFVTGTLGNPIYEVAARADITGTDIFWQVAILVAATVVPLPIGIAMIRGIVALTIIAPLTGSAETTSIEEGVTVWHPGAIDTTLIVSIDVRALQNTTCALDEPRLAEIRITLITRATEQLVVNAIFG